MLTSPLTHGLNTRFLSLGKCSSSLPERSHVGGSLEGPCVLLLLSRNWEGGKDFPGMSPDLPECTDFNPHSHPPVVQLGVFLVKRQIGKPSSECADFPTRQ